MIVTTDSDYFLCQIDKWTGEVCAVGPLTVDNDGYCHLIWEMLLCIRVYHSPESTCSNLKLTVSEYP